MIGDVAAAEQAVLLVAALLSSGTRWEHAQFFVFGGQPCRMTFGKLSPA